MVRAMAADAREYLKASRERGDVYISGKTEEHEPGGVSLGLIVTDTDTAFILIGAERIGAARVTEFRFLHLERGGIDQALPDILEEALAPAGASSSRRRRRNGSRRSTSGCGPTPTKASCRTARRATASRRRSRSI